MSPFTEKQRFSVSCGYIFLVLWCHRFHFIHFTKDFVVDDRNFSLFIFLSFNVRGHDYVARVNGQSFCISFFLEQGCRQNRREKFLS